MSATEQTYILGAIESLRNEMLARQDATNEKIDGVHTRLDTLNGKTGKNSERIGTLETKMSGLLWTAGVLMTAGLGGLVKYLVG